MAEVMLRKHQYIPLLDTSGTYNTQNWTPDWQRIDRSTIFDLNVNPTSEEFDYISYETPITEVTGYAPEMEQEVALYEGNPIFDYMFGLFYDLPVGNAVYVPTLICFAGTEKKAWQIKKTACMLKSLNTVDGKLTFTLKMGGDIDRGTYAISNGTATFTPSAGA